MRKPQWNEIFGFLMSELSSFLQLIIWEYVNSLVKLDIKWFIELDKYSNMNRAEMERKKIFGIFLENKMKIIEYALKENSDTLFVDSDTIILDN